MSSMYRTAGAALAVAAWLAGASHAVAQTDSSVTAEVKTELTAQGEADLSRPLTPVDAIVAVVGKQAIMRSQLDEQYYQILSTSPPSAKPQTAADSAKLRKRVLDDLVD